MKHIVSLSGGKDSTAMLLMMLNRGMPVDDIVFADTGMEFPELYTVLDQIEAATGRTITRVASTVSFAEKFEAAPVKRGKQAGMIGKGWPSMRNRWCTGELKRDPMRAYLRGYKDDITEYVGIACDEAHRARKKSMTGHNVRFPLIEWKVTERQALEYCYRRGITWDGLYEHRKRVSCYCCPFQSLAEWRHLRDTHPALWREALRLDDTPAGQRFKLREKATLFDLSVRFDREDRQDRFDFDLKKGAKP